MKTVAALCTALAVVSLLPCPAADPPVTMNVTGAAAARVLDQYRELSGLELFIASNVQRAGPTPITVEVAHTRPLERAEAARLLERALLEQAGIILTRLDDKRVSVTYNDALPVRRVPLKKATDP